MTETEAALIARVRKTELIAAIREYAVKNYEKGGWDVLVECWSDADIAEAIGNATTLRGAIWKLNKSYVSIWADRQADAANSAF